jgi:c-di-GMP-binding flagellar brake protein YcgR
MNDNRRVSERRTAKIPVRFRVVQEGSDMRVSEPVDGLLRDISRQGVALETPCIVVDGLHISYNQHPTQRNRVYLQWELPSKQAMKAVGETVWYERISTAEARFVVGLRFVEISAEDRRALEEFLERTVLDRPVSL